MLNLIQHLRQRKKIPDQVRDDQVVICHAELDSASQATKEDPGSTHG